MKSKIIHSIAEKFIANVRDKDLEKKDKDLDKDLKLHKNPKKLPPRMDLRKHQLDDDDFEIE